MRSSVVVLFCTSLISTSALAATDNHVASVGVDFGANVNGDDDTFSGEPTRVSNDTRVDEHTGSHDDDNTRAAKGRDGEVDGGDDDSVTRGSIDAERGLPSDAFSSTQDPTEVDAIPPAITEMSDDATTSPPAADSDSPSEKANGVPRRRRVTEIGALDAVDVFAVDGPGFTLGMITGGLVLVGAGAGVATGLATFAVLLGGGQFHPDAVGIAASIGMIGVGGLVAVLLTSALLPWRIRRGESLERAIENTAVIAGASVAGGVVAVALVPQFGVIIGPATLLVTFVGATLFAEANGLDVDRTIDDAVAISRPVAAAGTLFACVTTGAVLTAFYVSSALEVPVVDPGLSE